MTEDENERKEEELKSQDELPVVMTSDNLIEMATMAERRIQAVKRIKAAALKVTNINDWIDQNGNPYLQVSGAEKIRALFGISWRIDPPKIDRKEDGHYTYSYKGYFSMGSASIEFEGSRGSKDPFFSRSHDEDIPPSEINEADVKKSALTNTIGNGITRILGIRNLTWEEVEIALGIKREDAKKIDYGKKEMDKDVKELRDEIEKMLLEITGNSKVEFAKLLQQLTSFTGKDGKEVPGKSTLSDLTEKAIPVVYGKVKDFYDDFKKQEGKEVKNDTPKPKGKDGQQSFG